MSRFGLCDDLAAWTAPRCLDAKQLGCDIARIPLGWNRADEDLVAEGLERIRDAGMRPLICIWFHTDFRPPVEHFAWGAARYAERYPGAQLQLLNEPNHPLMGNLEPGPAAEYITAAAEAVRTVNPPQKLIAAAPSPGKEGWITYFREMHHGIADELGVDPALNVYPHQDRPLAAIEANFEIAKAYGKVHITELGFQAHVYGESRQADLTKAAMRKFAQLGAATVVVYRLALGPQDSEWEQKADLSVLDQPRMRQAFREGAK